MPKVELHLTPMVDESQVLVDGVDITSGLRGVTVEAKAGEFTRLTLDLLLVDVTHIEAEDVEIVVPDGTRDALVALGWTPPGS